MIGPAFLFILCSSCYDALTPERGVTANIPVLGTGDSGFESRRSERSEELNLQSRFRDENGGAISSQQARWRAGDQPEPSDGEARGEVESRRFERIC